jgi:hypothetical protein
MGEYEDHLARLRDEGHDDLAEYFQQFEASTLRKKAAERDQFEKDLGSTRGELERMKKAPKREEAFRKAGVNFEELRTAEKEVLQRLDWEGDEPSEEWVAQQVEKYGFPTSAPEGEDEEETGAQRVAAQARSAPARVKGGTTLSPEDTQDWPIEKLLKFQEKYPEQWDALKRGETVSGVAPPA